MSKKNVPVYLLTFLCLLSKYWCSAQTGPDPWNYDDTELTSKFEHDEDIPPDLQINPKKKAQSNTVLGNGEWFFRRILNIVMRGGQIKKNDDGSVDISLQMRLNEKQWNTLDQYVASPTAFSEDMYRRSVGYVEHAIYKPSITDKIVMAWTEHIQMYLEVYKMHITWTLALLGLSGAIIWLWNKMSHRHFTIIIILLLYMYEVFISYKEAEKQELDRFLAAVTSCKWYFWTSSCEVTKPDPLIFIKHMNPLKIAIRMFTTIISEPMLTLSDTLKTLVHGICDGLWFPFDKIVYGILLVSLNVLLLFLMVIILFNFIFNIPIDLSYLGLVSLKLRQRTRTMLHNINGNNDIPSERSGNARDVDRISDRTFNRVLDVFEALTAVQNKVHVNTERQNNGPPFPIRRSASTGRLPNTSSSTDDIIAVSLENVPRKRKVFKISHFDGSGDAQ